ASVRATAATLFYTLSLHDALPILDPVAHRQIGTLQAFPAAHVDGARVRWSDRDRADGAGGLVVEQRRPAAPVVPAAPHAAVVHRSEEHTSDSSHVSISYAVFCLKK